MILKRVLITALTLVLLIPALPAKAEVDQQAYEAGRSKLLSYMLRQQLSRHHYSDKELNDALSRAAFDLYLTQVDSRKRFLLQEDVDHLRSYAERIDDEMRRGRLDLPLVVGRTIDRRLDEVRDMVSDLLARPLDLESEDYLETDPEKLDYVENREQLRERWRKNLKFQVNRRYLNLLEDEGLDLDELETASQKKQAEELLEKAYEKVGESNEDFFHRLQEQTLQDYVDRYFNAVARAFDPHTGYLPPTQKEDFDISMRGSLEGIGATLREEDGYIKVVKIIPGSPAARQGRLQPEDMILKVAQGDEEPVDITDTGLRDAVSLIRGPKGSEVRLTVKRPDGSRVVIPIVRDVVQIEETFVKSTSIEDEKSEETFGYVKVPGFYRDFRSTSNGGNNRNVTDDLRKELEKLKEQNVSGIVLDLRNNGGGALTDAVSVTGLFIETGPVVQVRDGDGNSKVLKDQDSAVAYEGPLVVLVNRFSASASEIVAGAFQDYDRAIVIGGEHTHGKGTVQAILDLDQSQILPGMSRFKPLGAMRVTIQKFYRINGESTQSRGVVPDIVLPDRLAHLETGEQYIDYALPWDTISPVEYQKWDGSGGDFDLETLENRSSKRVRNSEDFSKIRKETKAAKKRRENSRQPIAQRAVWDENINSRSDSADLPPGHNAVDDENAGEPVEDDWDEELMEDPYTIESIAVLRDLVDASAAGIARTSAGD
ncbi:MAG: carboxy terminal-processing peptidase [Desulfuromonadales bacterium]